MAYTKKVVTGKANKKDNNRRKYTIGKEKDNSTEVDIDIEIEADDDYVVEKLSMDDLPATVDDGNQTLAVVWYNNFSIKKGNNYINQKFTVKLPNAKALRNSGKKIVLFDGNSNDGKPYIFTGNITDDDKFDLTDGDPAVGSAPP